MGAAPAGLTTATDPGTASTTAGGTDIVVCYCTGTLIRTVRDGVIADVAVEHLAIGDHAVTASGAHRPIRWIGHRSTDCRRYPSPEVVMPVRIAAHAFGENRPARDLLVSPGHSLCVDVVGEVLIPALSLINGTTITQEHVHSVTYWHVELENGHDILLAENMPAESYLEMGNRTFFAAAMLSPSTRRPTPPSLLMLTFAGRSTLLALWSKWCARSSQPAQSILAGR